MNDFSKRKAPWHLWAVGIISLLWNAGGAFDYLMTKLQAQSYLEQFTQEQLDFFFGFPQWVNATWAIAVWFSVLGSVYLLLRRRAAVPIFWISLLAMMATALHNFVLADVTMWDIMGRGAAVFTLVIFVVALLLVVYSRWLRVNRILV